MIEEQSGPPAWPMFEYLALALISGSVLAYELFVMRVFACAGWSHFGSFVISIAMLGFGVFSTILCIRKNYFQKRLFFWVKLSMLLLGPSMAVCNALAQRIDFNPIFLISDPKSEIPARLIFFDLSSAFPTGCDVYRPDFSAQKRGVRDGLFRDTWPGPPWAARRFYWACTA